VVWRHIDQAGQLDELLASADGLIVRTYTQVDEALLAKAPKLKVVGRAGVGLDNFDLPACRKHNVRVVYTPDANTQAVVEYVTALILDAYRPLPASGQSGVRSPQSGVDAESRVQSRGSGVGGQKPRGQTSEVRSDEATADSGPRTPDPSPWTADLFHSLRKTLVGRQVEEMTLGILGFGRIGKRVGEVARAIGMNLHVNDLLPEVELRKAVDYAFEFVPISRLYSEADVLTIHIDGRPGNRHFVNDSALAMFKTSTRPPWPTGCGPTPAPAPSSTSTTPNRPRPTIPCGAFPTPASCPTWPRAPIPR